YRKPVARTEREWPVQLIKQRWAHFDAVDSAGVEVEDALLADDPEAAARARLDLRVADLRRQLGPLVTSKNEDLRAARRLCAQHRALCRPHTVHETKSCRCIPGHRRMIVGGASSHHRR